VNNGEKNQPQTKTCVAESEKVQTAISQEKIQDKNEKMGTSHLGTPYIRAGLLNIV
jgi:hypothetical protein